MIEKYFHFAKKRDTTDLRNPIAGLDTIEEPCFGLIYHEEKVSFRVRELLEYAKQKGVDPMDLTPEEYAMFDDTKK